VNFRFYQGFIIRVLKTVLHLTNLNTLMTINQMAWLAAGASYLAIAGVNSIAATGLVNSSIPPASTHSPIATAMPHTPVDRPSDRSIDAPTAHPLAAMDTTNALWRCPASLTQPLPIRKAHPHFPVKMQGCVVAYVSTAQQAQNLSQQLDRQLQTAQTDWAAVTPQVTGDRVSIRFGQQHWLTLEPTIAAQFKAHPHQLITDWANNIRIVAGHRPLTLAQAQQQMYAVAPTAQVAQGEASWYGPYFHGRMTANGETFNQHDLTAAHRTLPLGTYVQVTNRQNGRSVVVRINDRGPYLDEDRRIIDLSHRAAQTLEGETKGIVPIELVVLKAQPKSTWRNLSQTNLSQTNLPQTNLSQTIAFSRLDNPPAPRIIR
jgi:rare lipoprotein A (peptidoglycan hydrolase)